MQIEYYNNKIMKIMSNLQILKEIIGLEMTKSIKKRYNEIEASNDFQELMKNNFGHPHPLKGNLKQYYGIGITGNYRLIIGNNYNKRSD